MREQADLITTTILLGSPSNPATRRGEYGKTTIDMITYLYGRPMHSCGSYYVLIMMMMIVDTGTFCW